MIITILWEDQRGSPVKGYGPHELLVSCAVDELQCARKIVADLVHPVPKKGNNKVIAALQKDLEKLARSGPVCAVLDRDRVRELWAKQSSPPNCIGGIRQAMADRAPGTYELVLLIDNTETLITACCQAMSKPVPPQKPNPSDRDILLNQVAWGTADQRKTVRDSMPSFDRLVRWVCKEARNALGL